jgi:hypothetical protein
VDESAIAISSGSQELGNLAAPGIDGATRRLRLASLAENLGAAPVAQQAQELAPGLQKAVSTWHVSGSSSEANPPSLMPHRRAGSS